MAKRHRELLARLEPVGLNRYQITEADVRSVETYLRIIQAHLQGQGVSTWADILRYGDAYGTSLLIHEIVELRGLQARGFDPLRLDRHTLSRLLGQNVEAHVLALFEEHLYLQEVLIRQLGQSFELGTLVRANTNDEDFEFFLESDVGVFLVEEERIEAARRAIAQLKGKTA